MYRYSYIILLSFIVSSVQAFFIHGEKEPILFCIKVCPLYCAPRRRDDDASSLIYIDDYRDVPHRHDHEIPYHFDPYYFWKPPKPTTTSPTPTTTPPVPTTTPPAPTTTPPAPTTTPPVPTTTPPAPTTMKTTTIEPPWICVLCMNKCRKYPVL